jgi:uncharacterized membrane protein
MRPLGKSVSKNKSSSQHGKPLPPATISPVSSAVDSIMPTVYGVTYAQTQTQSHSGPLPPPEILKRYDEVNPGLALRIVQVAEKEAEHRREIEFQIVNSQTEDQRAYRRSELLGQIFGLLIGIGAIAGAVICGIKGAQIAASFIGTTGVTGLVTAFILGRSYLLKLRQQEIDQQQQQQQSQQKPRVAEHKKDDAHAALPQSSGDQ